MKKKNLIFRPGKTKRDKARNEAQRRIINREKRQEFHDSAKVKGFNWKDYPWRAVNGKKNRVMREYFLKEK